MQREKRINLNFKKGLLEAQRILINMPIEQKQKAHWIPRTYIGRGTIQMHVCSNCRQEFGYDAETGIEFSDYNYCPNCGAEMESD